MLFRNFQEYHFSVYCMYGGAVRGETTSLSGWVCSLPLSAPVRLALTAMLYLFTVKGGKTKIINQSWRPRIQSENKDRLQ